MQPSMRDMRVFVDGINPSRIERTRPSNNAVHLITLPEEKLREIRSILSCNATNQRLFHNHTPSSWGGNWLNYVSTKPCCLGAIPLLLPQGAVVPLAWSLGYALE